MTRDDIIKMAREADMIDFRDDDSDPHVKQFLDFLERFAALVAQAEREACAKLLDARRTRPPMGAPDDVERGFNAGLIRGAAAIRERGALGFPEITS